MRVIVFASTDPPAEKVLSMLYKLLVSSMHWCYLFLWFLFYSSYSHLWFCVTQGTNLYLKVQTYTSTLPQTILHLSQSFYFDSAWMIKKSLLYTGRNLTLKSNHFQRSESTMSIEVESIRIWVDSNWKLNIIQSKMKFNSIFELN